MEFSLLIKRFVDENAQSFIVPLIFLILVIAMHLLPFNKLGDGYIEQQWFLNYSSGFIRRGLFGELVAHLNLDLKQLYIFFRILITLSFTLFFGIAWYSFGRIKSKNILYFLLIATSPIYYSAYAKLNGRFDLIFNLVITVLFLFKNNKYSKFILFLSIVPLGFLHELWLIFYVPIYYVLINRDRWRAPDHLILFFNYFILLFLWLETKAPLTDVTGVCKEIMRGLEGLLYSCYNEQYISFSTQSLSSALDNVLFFGRERNFISVFKGFVEYLGTVTYVFLASLPLVFVSLRGQLLKQINNKLEILLLIGIYLLISLVALDWGRFLIDILQLYFIHKLINGKMKFNVTLNMPLFIALFLVNLFFIKLVFTRIPIF